MALSSSSVSQILFENPLAASEILFREAGIIAKRDVNETWTQRGSDFRHSLTVRNQDQFVGYGTSKKGARTRACEELIKAVVIQRT